MKKNKKYQRILLGALVLSATLGLFANYTHAQVRGAAPIIKQCIDVNGSIYSYGTNCVTGGNTCIPTPCPPAP